MTSEVESCGSESSFAYEQFKMDSTLVTEFDMVCNKSREVVLVFYLIKMRPWNISDLGAHDWFLLHAGPCTWQPGLWPPL